MKVTPRSNYFQWSDLEKKEHYFMFRNMCKMLRTKTSDCATKALLLGTLAFTTYKNVKIGIFSFKKLRNALKL